MQVWNRGYVASFQHHQGSSDVVLDNSGRIVAKVYKDRYVGIDCYVIDDGVNVHVSDSLDDALMDYLDNRGN